MVRTVKFRFFCDKKRDGLNGLVGCATEPHDLEAEDPLNTPGFKWIGEIQTVELGGTGKDCVKFLETVWGDNESK